MSGPKSSRYVLSAAQLQRILEEQERRRKELAEKARIEREIHEAYEHLAAIKVKNASHFKLLKDYQSRLTDKDAVPRLSEKYSEVFDLIQENNFICTVKENESHSNLLNAVKKADCTFREIIKREENIISETDRILKEQRVKNDSIIASGMNLSFDKIGYIEPNEDPLQIEIKQILDQLMKLDIPQDLSTDVQNAKKQADQMKDSYALKNFLAITVKPLKKKCLDYVSFAESNRNKYIALEDKYNALCKESDIMPITFEFSESGLTDLEEAISVLECELLKSAEQSYIRKSIDDVMTEMGYEVIGKRHVKKKSGKEFNSRLLTYDDGTVINITETSNGQITMEIGGVDNTDRLPDYNERVALRKKMESFCFDFKEIEKRLNERGVLLGSRISMAPPEEIYAQIINIKDYELKEIYTVHSAARTNENTKKLRQNNE